MHRCSYIRNTFGFIWLAVLLAMSASFIDMPEDVSVALIPLSVVLMLGVVMFYTLKIWWIGRNLWILVNDFKLNGTFSHIFKEFPKSACISNTNDLMNWLEVPFGVSSSCTYVNFLHPSVFLKRPDVLLRTPRRFFKTPPSFFKRRLSF